MHGAVVGMISHTPMPSLLAVVLALLAVPPHLTRRHTAAAEPAWPTDLSVRAMWPASVASETTARGMWATAGVLLTLTPAALGGAPPTESPPPQQSDANEGGVKATSVLIVSTSRFWHNYRHAANALSVYRTVKRLGVHDDNIVLMLAGQPANPPRRAHGVLLAVPLDVPLRERERVRHSVQTVRVRVTTWFEWARASGVLVCRNSHECRSFGYFRTQQRNTQMRVHAHEHTRSLTHLHAPAYALPITDACASRRVRLRRAQPSTTSHVQHWPRGHGNRCVWRRCRG
jgi:hypothetical protein